MRNLSNCIKKKSNNFTHDIIKNKILWLMLMPAILYFGIFKFLPMIGFIAAFKQYKMYLGIFKSPWSGFKNFEFLFISGTFTTLIKNTLLYNFVFIVLGNTLQLAVAIMLSYINSRTFKKISQSVMFFPYFVSYVILAILTYNIFNYENGTVNNILVSLGQERIDVYSMPGIWKYILVFFHSWKWLGYGSVIYLAAIMGIDKSIYESARIDGASTLKQIFKITIPLLKPTLITLILLAIGRIFYGQFELFYQIIGDNGQLYKATDILDTFMFRSLVKTFNIGMGLSAKLLRSVLGLITILLANFIVKRVDDDYALF